MFNQVAEPLAHLYDPDPTTLHLLIRHLAALRGGPVMVDVRAGDAREVIFLSAYTSVPEPPDGHVTAPPANTDGPALGTASPEGAASPGPSAAEADWDPDGVWATCAEALTKGAAPTSALWQRLRDAGCDIAGRDLDLLLKERRIAGELAFDGDVWSLPVPSSPAGAKTRQKPKSKKEGRQQRSDDGIVAAVRAAGEISSTALAVAAGIPKGSISYRLGKLIDAGVVERLPDSKLYRLVSGSAPTTSSASPPASAPPQSATAAGVDPLEQAILDVVETCTFSQRSKGIAPSAVHSQLPIPMRSRTNVHEVAQLLGLLADAEKVVKVRTGHYAPFGGS